MAEASAKGRVERAEPTKAQRSAARRVAESKATIPHLYMTAELDLGPALKLAADSEGDPGAREVLIRAVALALRANPRLNGSYRDGAAETYERVNVGVTVAGAEAPVVPTIFDADGKDLDELAGELSSLEARAASGELTARELAGGTFTVAPSGPAVRAFAPVIHGGQAANLGLGGLAAGDALTVTLAVDARMIDAPTASGFLERLRAVVQDPPRLA